MSEKIKVTREFFAKHPRVIIRPETEAEAVNIQKLLFALDIKWPNKDTVGMHITECISKGMVVENLKLYHSPTSEPALTIPVSSFVNGVTAYDFMTEPEKLRHDFNLLSKKVDRILELLESRPLPSIPAKPRTTGAP